MYPKGDIRRWFLVLVALEQLESPTLANIAQFTGLNKGTIPVIIRHLRAQLGASIEKNGAEYRLSNWGPALDRGGVFSLLGLTG